MSFSKLTGPLVKGDSTYEKHSRSLWFFALFSCKPAIGIQKRVLFEIGNKPKANHQSQSPVLPLTTSEGLSVDSNSPATEAWAESFISSLFGSSIMDGSLCSSQSSDIWLHNTKEVKSYGDYRTKYFMPSQKQHV